MEAEPWSSKRCRRQRRRIEWLARLPWFGDDERCAAHAEVDEHELARVVAGHETAIDDGAHLAVVREGS